MFETVQEDRERREILSKCLAQQGRILSLGSFLEDTKLLSPTSDVMKLLMPSHLTTSIKGLLEKCFESSESSSQTRRREFQSSYRRLWLFAWRNFPEMITSNQISLRRGRAPSRFQRCPTKKAGFGALSKRLGFGSAGITTAQASPSNAQAVKQFLQSFSQGQTYKTTDMKAAVQAIEAILDKFLLTTRPLEHESPILSQNRTAPRDEERHGMPFEASFDEDRSSLQMELLYRPTWETPNAPLRYVSSFGILRDQFRCFFGLGEETIWPETPGQNLTVSALSPSPEQHELHSFISGLSSSSQSDASSDTFWDADENPRMKRSFLQCSQSDEPSAIRRRMR